MTSGPVPNRDPKGIGAAFRLICSLCRPLGKAGIAALAASVLIFWLGATSLPLMADGTDTLPVQSAAGGEDFGQYLADHQADLAPFFSKNADDLFKLGVPMLMSMLGWVICLTLLAGWGIDILMSRGFAFFFAPAFTDLKRSIIYATGRLFLSFVYTCLIGLAIVFSLKLAHAGIVTTLVVLLLLGVALAAQIVWILYLYRTSFSLSAVFYLAIIIVHGIAGFLIAQPFIGLRASNVATNFVDRIVTPKLQTEVESTKRELAGVESARDAVRAKADDLQHQIAQSHTEQERLRMEIEQKKNSDIYVLAQIEQVRARDELDSARSQLTAFFTTFPTSSLNTQAREQLAQINDQIAVEQAQKQQEEAEAARAAQQARADLLARAAKGDVTLSEMRQALIGKTRAQVGDLLGLPSETASDSWGYRQRMIFNPLTNARYGLTVYFLEGAVQGVDYNRNGGSQ